MAPGFALSDVAGATPPALVCVPRSSPIGQGPAMLERQSLDAGTGGRITDLTLYSPALNGTTHVDVMLPRKYDASGNTRYPSSTCCTESAAVIEIGSTMASSIELMTPAPRVNWLLSSR